MTFLEFSELTTEQRSDAVMEWGFFVSKVKSGELNRVLYSLNGFFAEMIIKVSDNEIIYVNPISTITKQVDSSYSLESDNPFVKSSIATGLQGPNSN